MFNSLRGRLTATGAGFICLETSGIEWRLTTSSATVRAVRQAAGTGDATGGGARDVRVLVHLYHREDALALYGFATEEERRAFLELLKVSGIGPRQALKILSGIEASALQQAIEAGDTSTLSRLPGIGTKSAQKIIFQLAETLPPVSASPLPSEVGDVVQGLVDMGYDRVKAQTVVADVHQEVAGEGLGREEREQELFRRSLVRLG